MAGKDTLARQQRQLLMQSVTARDTRPELQVRSTLHRLGYRYRLHDRRLPGTPDLVFPSKRKVIFVNGCFWHRHSCRKGRSTPSTNVAFWQDKFDRNVRRDRRVKQQLRRLGWRHFVVWECQLAPRKLDALLTRLVSFLDDD
jgi:DNA mismatch endonuclease (patch repair protein)